VAEIGIDAINLRKPQRPGPIRSVILQALAFGVTLHLSIRGLAQIHDRFALQVQGGDFGMRVKRGHRLASLQLDRLR
jgi:hypothetical protein